MDMSGWLLIFISGGNWVDPQFLVRLLMMTVTTWSRALFCTTSCVMTKRFALVLRKFSQACYYGSLVIRDVTERFVLFVKD